MIEIRNKCLESMTSPIRHVMIHIHEALINIAPENMKLFETEYPDFILEYLDSDKWILKVNTDTKHIQISRRVVEIFWAVSYGYITLYTEVIQGKIIIEKTVINLHKDEKVRNAMQLLKWIYESWLNNESNPWPTDLPRPIENPKKGIMENVADELCLSSIAYLIHHELAHIKLLHSGGSTIDIEKEADAEATDWLLNHDIDEWDYKFIKRALAIAVSFETITARGIYTGDFGGNTHPKSYDRLFHSLDNYIQDPKHIVWALVAFTLKLHIDNKNITTPDIEYKDFRECVNNYIDLISKS